ncbi:MAG: YjbF family lipoprotein, partial [Proteobacteria bacterium]|nr:YjbF family lipoprotein [Pseudomonadota bacterium]
MAKTKKIKVLQNNSNQQAQALNQRNAQFSTGPVSAAGKKRCAQNAWVHRPSQALQAEDLDGGHQEMAVTLQHAGCSAGQSATMALAMQDFQGAKDFRATIDPVRYQRRALKQLRQVLATKVLPFVFILFLTACAPFGLYNNAYQASVEYFNPAPFVLTPQIKNLPYAMQLVEHRGKSAVMVLAHADQQKLTWVDSESNEFTTLHGKIINSQGMTNDFESLHPPNIHEIFQFLVQRIHSSVERESLVRFLKPTTTFLQAKHTFSLSPKAAKLFERKIDGKLLEYYILTESIEIPAVRGQYSNTYWLDTSGRVLKSKQFITPDQPKYY